MSHSQYRPRQHPRRRWDDGDIAKRRRFIVKALTMDLRDPHNTRYERPRLGAPLFFIDGRLTNVR